VRANRGPKATVVLGCAGEEGLFPDPLNQMSETMDANKSGIDLGDKNNKNRR